MACVWIYNPKLTVDSAVREGRVSRHGVGSTQIFYIATEIYVQTMDGVVKIKDQNKSGRNKSIRWKQHIFLDTLTKTYWLINFNTTSFGEPIYSSSSEERLLMALKTAGWRAHEPKSN